MDSDSTVVHVEGSGTIINCAFVFLKFSGFLMYGNFSSLGCEQAGKKNAQ